MDDSSPRRRRGGRRPEGDRGPPRGRGREDRDGFDRERSEREFTQEMQSRLKIFVEAEETELALEPMNSFKRRIAHNLAKDYQIQSESRGEERERHVFLRKTAETAIPPERPAEPEREQPAAPEREESAAPEREERPAPERAERPERPARPERSDRDAPRSSSRSSSRAWDFGSQTFPVKPGPAGVHIALKVDGSVELYREADKNYVVADRVVTARQFRIRGGKIVQPGEPGW